MPIDFYYIPGSAPCGSVLMAAKAVGVELNCKKTDLMKGEHLTPEFIKMNPQHTLPTINDNGFCLWESRTIMRYFVDNYAKNDSLYPKDPKKRAMVDQRLDYDLGNLYARFSMYYYPVMFQGQKFNPEIMTQIQESYKILDTFLSTSEFAAGNHLTIADFALLSSISTYEAVGFDFSAYKNVTKWYAKAKAAFPHYEETNGTNAQQFKELFNHIMANK